jgi:hypothetical protein
MGSPRIKGTGLRLVIDGVDHYADCTSVVLDHEPTVTQRNAAKQFEIEEEAWYFDVTAVQSTDLTSLWSLLWENAHKFAAVTYAPHGNPTPTPLQPHFTATVQLGAAPALGGEAGASVEYVFTTRFPCKCKPTRVDTP